jgi:hypothetical protein
MPGKYYIPIELSPSYSEQDQAKRDFIAPVHGLKGTLLFSSGSGEEAVLITEVIDFHGQSATDLTSEISQNPEDLKEKVLNPQRAAQIARAAVSRIVESHEA